MMEEKNANFANFSSIEMNSCQIECPKNNLSSIFEGNIHDSFTSCIEEMNNFVLDDNETPKGLFTQKVRTFKSTMAKQTSMESNLCISGDSSVRKLITSLLQKRRANTSLVGNLDDYPCFQDENRN